MIQGSYEWKQAVKRNNAYIRRMGSTALAAEASHLLDRIQMRIVTNALFVRRLLETPMVVTAMNEHVVPVTAYPWTGVNVDIFNRHTIEDKYQLENGSAKALQGEVLCNQIIHSHIWTWLTDDANLMGFFVSSDRKKHSEAFMVALEDFLEFTQIVAQSRPGHVSATRDPQTNQWEWRSE